jgi:hypothetical protein
VLWCHGIDRATLGLRSKERTLVGGTGAAVSCTVRRCECDVAEKQRHQHIRWTCFSPWKLQASYRDGLVRWSHGSGLAMLEIRMMRCVVLWERGAILRPVICLRSALLGRRKTKANITIATKLSNGKQPASAYCSLNPVVDIEIDCRDRAIFIVTKS